VLAIVYRTIATHLINKAGVSRNTARTGAVTLIQRFGSALNLNMHLHCLVLDKMFRCSAGEPVFREARAPATAELQGLVEKIVARMISVLILFACR